MKAAHSPASIHGSLCCLGLINTVELVFGGGSADRIDRWGAVEGRR
jgi:hypothetical protein